MSIPLFIVDSLSSISVMGNLIEGTCHFPSNPFSLPSSQIHKCQKMMAISVLPFLSWNAWTSLAIGLLLNVLLLFLAIRHSSGDLREYRPIVFHFCFLDIFCIFLYAICQPIFIFSADGRSFVFFCGLMANLSSIELRMAFFCLLFIIYFMIMAGLGLQFLDRYLLLCRSLTNVPRRYAIVIGLQLLFPLVIILLAVNNLPLKDYDLNEILPSDDRDSLKKDSSEGEADISPNLKVVSEANMQNRITKILFILLGTLLAINYLIVIICYTKIRAFLKQNLSANGPTTNTRDSLQQITRNMLFQALLPMYTMVLFGVNIGFLLNSEYSPWLLQFQALSFLPISWLPLLNPLVTILTIRNYRNGLLAICGMKKMAKQNEVNIFNKTSTHPFHSTTNK